MPSRSRLPSAAVRITFADSPSGLSMNPVPGERGAAPSLVAIVISSPMPRLRRQRPRSASLSPPMVPCTQYA